jgi:hypothetical protein
LRTLLGHLAQFSALQSQGEMLCTQGLAFVLQDPGASAAFAEALGRWSGIEVPVNLSWRAEAHQIEDAGRPDLEALAPDGSPVIKVEAKLGAGLSPSQLRSYALDLTRRSGGGILLLLVPAHRMGEAASTVTAAFDTTGNSLWIPESLPAVTVIAVSWEELFRELEAADSRPDMVLGLREMYGAITGYVLKPLADSEALRRWMEREKDFIELVDRSTRRLQQDHGCWMGPFGQETIGDDNRETLHRYYRRYLCRPMRGEQPYFSIGVRPPFEGCETPIWLRFNRDTPLFPLILDRLESSNLAERLVISGGHVWFPLDVPLGENAEQMVEALVQQSFAIVDVAMKVIPRDLNCGSLSEGLQV